MVGLRFSSSSSAIVEHPAIISSRWQQRIKTLVPHQNRRRQRRLVAGRLSHYSALYEVQNEQPGLPLDVAHLHHMVHGASNALGPLYFATFCALSVTLGALLYNLTNVLNEYFALQQQLSDKTEDKPLLYGVDVSSSKMFSQKRVRDAVAFAAKAHAGQVRKTGEPYVTHCIETALIVETNLPHWRQDSRHETAVIAALLHDVLDDTPTTPEALSAAFGPTVTAMVVSVSKLSAVNQMLRRDKRKGVVSRDQSFWQSQWRRLKRMMFEAVVEEPLVILVKLADRLHNMRTVYALPPAKQQAVAEETLAVWCSMAASLGWHSLKSEMEDLCFAVLDTSTFCALRQELDKVWSSPPPPRSRRRVKSSRRQLQLQQFAEQQQQLAAERAGKWGQGLITRLRQGFSRQLQQGFGIPAALLGGSSSSTRPQQADGSSSSSAAESAGALTQTAPQQQQGSGGSLNVLLHGLWPQAPSAAASGLLPAPEEEEGDVTPSTTPQSVTSHEEPKRPSGAEWGVTDAALSLRSLLGSSSSSITGSSSTNSSSGGANAEPPAASAASVVAIATSSSSSGAQLSPQQQQLRNILSTVVPFDAVSLTGGSRGLTWSAQQGLRVLDEAASRLYNELAVGSFSGGLKVEIQGRLKSLRSVYNKMERKQCSVEEVYDARALRVVVDDGGGARLADAVQCCYRLVSAVHKLWRPIHGEFDDYIANPKPSGYQALHTAVWGPGGAALEVQIKTAGMHEHAEYGGAAHWAYKEVLWGSAPAAAAAVDNVERNVAAAAAAAMASSSGGSSAATAAEQQQQELLPLSEGAAAAVAAAAVAARRSSKVQVLPTVMFTFDDEGQLVGSSSSSSSSSMRSSSSQQGRSSATAAAAVAAAVGGVATSSGTYSSSSSSSSTDTAVLARPSAAATRPPVASQREGVALEPAGYAAAGAAGATATVAAAAGGGGGGLQLAERPRLPRLDLQQVGFGGSSSSSRALGTLERPEPPTQQQQQGWPPAGLLPRQQPSQPSPPPPPPPPQQQQQRPVPEVYVGQPVLRVSDRLRYGVVLAAANHGSSGGGSSSSGGSPLLQLSPEAAAAELSLRAAAAASASATGSSSNAGGGSSNAGGSSSSSSLVCVIMSGGTNPDHPWRMPDYGFYAELLGYATAQGWLRPGQGDWHARLEEYEWCRDGRWHRRDHMGYLHPHTTLTLLEGYEQAAADAAGPTQADPAAAAAATAADDDLATAAAAATAVVPGSKASSNSSSRSSSAVGAAAVPPTGVQPGGALLAAESSSDAAAATAATAAAPARVTPAAAAAGTSTRAVADAAMLRHSWATGGAGSSWRQQQQQQQQQMAAAAAAAAAAPEATSKAVGLQGSTTASSSSSSSSTGDGGGARQLSVDYAFSPLSSADSSSSDSNDDNDVDTSQQQPLYMSAAAAGSSTAGSGGGGGIAAAGSDWVATAAKAAQLRSVIEWGLEAYGVNAAGSSMDQSSEVSVVIWPGGLIEDVPRGTTAGQILREKGVFAILDATSSSSSSASSSAASSPSSSSYNSSSSDSDAEVTPNSSSSSIGSSSSTSRSRKTDRSSRQRLQQQRPASSSTAAAAAAEVAAAGGGQQLVNVNNRLVSEDTVLRDGDLVILARERIKI